MSSETVIPDYDLEDRRLVSSSQELRAMFHPLRSTLLELVVERAATVGELAAAVERPKGTVAHHVGVLLEAGLLRVVRTRKVRAVEERFYGRTPRIFQVGVIAPEQVATITNHLSVAAAESRAAHEADDLRAIIRHARVSTTNGLRSSGTASSSWYRSSRDPRVRATPSMHSSPGSTRLPSTRPCPRTTPVDRSGRARCHEVRW